MIPSSAAESNLEATMRLLDLLEQKKVISYSDKSGVRDFGGLLNLLEKLRRHLVQRQEQRPGCSRSPWPP